MRRIDASDDLHAHTLHQHCCRYGRMFLPPADAYVPSLGTFAEYQKLQHQEVVSSSLFPRIHSVVFSLTCSHSLRTTTIPPPPPPPCLRLHRQRPAGKQARRRAWGSIPRLQQARTSTSTSRRKVRPSRPRDSSYNTTIPPPTIAPPTNFTAGCGQVTAA